ncbi:unnamed protein product [Closterium sp. Naga37s-1]|nr:unnamed protein product [Closterium sp. Naga37s-1]
MDETMTALLNNMGNTLALLMRQLETAEALPGRRSALKPQKPEPFDPSQELTLGRIDARLGPLEGVVVDSMEGAQKKLTDKVSRKIDNMLTAVSATAERAITTSGVTNALHTLITLVSGSPLPRTDPGEMHAMDTAKPGDTENGKRVAGAKADNQWGVKRQKGPQTATAVDTPSVQDMLKQKWGARGRGAGQPAPPGSCSRYIPAEDAATKPPARAQAHAMVTAGKGKGKQEEEPATTDKGKGKHEVQHAAADAKQSAIAPAPAAATIG